MIKLTDQELFKMMAFKYYTGLDCMSLHDFKTDLKRFKYTGNLIEKYSGKSPTERRIILNHIIIIRNIFGEFTQTGLFNKTEHSSWKTLKELLIELQIYRTDNDVESVIKNISTIETDAHCGYSNTLDVLG